MEQRAFRSRFSPKFMKREYHPDARVNVSKVVGLVSLLCLAQEGAFTLHPSELLEESEGDHFRVREAIYGLVASSTVGVEHRVSVVYEAGEHGQSLF
jgi:hypothetical protein